MRHLLGEGDRLYLTLDDFDVLAQARDAPDQIVRRAPPRKVLSCAGQATEPQVTRHADLVFGGKNPSTAPAEVHLEQRF